jgi:hypothetical protein
MAEVEQVGWESTMEWVVDGRTFDSKGLKTGESSAEEVAILAVGSTLDKRRGAALVAVEGINHVVVLMVLEEVEVMGSYEVGCSEIVEEVVEYIAVVDP